MAKEKITPNTEFEFKLSEMATRLGYACPFMDGCSIEVYPAGRSISTVLSGQQTRTVMGEFTPAKTVVVNSRGERTECADGFKELTPKQVYDLANAGIIVLSKSRGHEKIYKDYLATIVGDTLAEDY